MYVFLDTETNRGPSKSEQKEKSGFENVPIKIVQMSYLITDDNFEVLKTFNKYYYSEKISPRAYKTHGLSPEDLKELSKSTFEEDSELILVDLKEDVLVTHNIEWDWDLCLKEEFKRCNVEYSQNTFCTMKYFTNICKIPNPYGYKNYKWPSLEELLKYLKITKNEVSDCAQNYFGSVNGQHDSRFDSTAVYLAFKKASEKSIIKNGV
ncbi:DNA polymerase-3 subunit epsilon [Methanococcus maripaludis]|uniref:DNA polymerase-3 subunit epsilon n=1 Tax=Methanococcus maripaludis TaxID=39152 RepID=A0A7J9P0K6_METMI|nr:3'-5' exonuclease [Methanococcus maripaludis]MBA2853478.1 DNA polymerase-3 subunit epsilon [Methanococcus maripaludis]